jgi:hypothetical protein
MRVMMELYRFAPITKHVSASQCEIIILIWEPVVRICAEVPKAVAVCLIFYNFWTFVVHSENRKERSQIFLYYYTVLFRREKMCFQGGFKI